MTEPCRSASLGLLHHVGKIFALVVALLKCTLAFHQLTKITIVMVESSSNLSFKCLWLVVFGNFFRLPGTRRSSSSYQIEKRINISGTSLDLWMLAQDGISAKFQKCDSISHKVQIRGTKM